MVAKIPVLDKIELPGKASMMEFAFSFGSTGVERHLMATGVATDLLAAALRAILEANILVIGVWVCLLKLTWTDSGIHT